MKKEAVLELLPCCWVVELDLDNIWLHKNSRNLFFNLAAFLSTW